MEKLKSYFKSSPWFLLIIAFVVFLASILVGQSFDTQGGSVKVQDIYFTSSIDGSLQHGRIYIPPNATPETPAPAVIWIPGNDTDAERCAMFGVEFSRRGYVVYLSDIRNQGSSVGKNVGLKDDSNGAIEATEFVRSLSMVDKENIAIGGHSLGGMDAVTAYLMQPDWYESVYGFGIANTMTKIPIDARVDVLGITGRDESVAHDWTAMAEYYCQCDVSEFDPNKVYGSFEDNNARQNYQAMNAVHATEYWNDEVLEVAIDFIQGSSPAPKPIPGSDQVWKNRYVATTVALIALVFMLIPLGTILIQTPFFATIVRPVPEYKGNTKARWWIFAVITAIFAPATYLSWSRWGTNWLPTNIFNIRRATMSLGWALMVAGVTVVAITLGYFLTKKEERFSLQNLALTYEKGETLKNIGKSLLLSVIMLAAMYSLVLVTHSITKMDARIWNMSFRVLNWQRMVRILKYFLPYAFCYVVLGANIHGFLRPNGGKVSLIKEILINVFLLSPWYFVWAIWLGPFSYLRNGGVIPAFSGFLYTFFWGVPVMMAIIAVLSTYFFRKTGRVYLAAFVNAWLVCWVLLGVISLYA